MLAAMLPVLLAALVDMVGTYPTSPIIWELHWNGNICQTQILHAFTTPFETEVVQAEL